MSISTELKSLERAFLSLPNEGVIPKETPLISSIKGLLQQSSRVTMIGHIIATDFEESLSTLQYVERCKAEVVGSDRGGADGLGATGDQLLRNLRQVNEEYKKEIESTERRNDAQFERLRSVLGLTLDLKSMMQKGPNQREYVVLENHRQANDRAKNFHDRNHDIEVRLSKTKSGIDKIKQKIDDKSYYFTKLLKSMNEDLAALTAECNALKVQYNNLPMEMRDRIEEERKKCVEQKGQELEDKFDVLFSSQGAIDQHNESMIEATRIRENARRDFEAGYKTCMSKQKKVMDEEMVNLDKQYEYYLKKKKDELAKFMVEAEKYCKKKRDRLATLREEACHLAYVVKQQTHTISQAEDGAFSGGIKSLNIKKSQKVNLTCGSPRQLYRSELDLTAIGCWR